ncbi:MAG: septum formation protein Maf [Alphaproteobacteria bacterium]|nr:septum formation protein Maf [Alphaproteobacteria bacterium]
MTSLVLASASAIRASLLRGAGVAFEIDPANIDEDEVKRSMRAAGASPREQADALAALKAAHVSRRRPGLVLGADQMLAIEGETLDKPADRAAARAHLHRLRGRTHQLMCAAAIAAEGAVVWRFVATPTLRMRMFSDEFMEDYLDRVGEAALKSVGAYQLEGLGAQLFEQVDGDYFSVLGLPLLPLLAFLREYGVVPA